MNENDKTESERELENLKRSIYLMFSKYIENEPSEDIETISQYFNFIRNAIDHKKGSINADQSLIDQFEAVCLLLKDRLRLYPDSLTSQVVEILKDKKLTQFFGLLSTLDESERQKIGRISPFINMILSILNIFGIKRFPVSIVFYKLGETSEGLLDTKIALNRLSQILKYASTIELLDYDSGESELKEHYDQDLVEKPKLIALINILRIQAKAIPDKDIRDRINERVDKIENEIQKRKPRWGRIIAAVFILFGFVADLKTISPDIYQQIYTTIQNIIVTLHEEGQPHREKRTIVLDQGEHSGVLPRGIELLKPEEENKD